MDIYDVSTCINVSAPDFATVIQDSATPNSLRILLGQSPFRGQVKGGDVFLAYLDGQTTPRALAQASIHDLGTGSYVLLLPGDTLLPGDQFGYQKTKGHQHSTYLDVLKSHVMPEGR